MLENHKFNKKFGQNFLSDKNLLAAIVSDAQITKEDDVLEIGAGGGALTEQLALKAKKVVSYEIDKTLTEHLNELASNFDNLQIIIDDALKLQIDEIEKNFGGDYKLVANLPYYITSPLIFKFLEQTQRCKSITVMVQKEVAERFCAKAGDVNYGIPSVMINFYCNQQITRNVSRKMFYPMPNVDSAVIRLDRKQLDVDKIFVNKFSKVVNSSFAMRRKTLVNNLTKNLNISREEVVKVLQKLNINEMARAEELTLEDYKNLTAELKF